MLPSGEVWLESLEPPGFIRADKIVRIFTRRGANLSLPEAGPETELTDVSFCVEVDAPSIVYLVGCTDDVDGAARQFVELVNELLVASRNQSRGPVFVYRNPARPPRPGHEGPTPSWVAGSALPMHVLD